MATRSDESEGNKSKLGRGIRVRSQTKEVIHNVHDYFERINKKVTTKTPVKRTSEATKLGETTVRLILKEKKEKGTFESPAKRYKRSRKEVVDDYDEEGIRKAIYAMYDRKEHITLNKLLKIVREDQLFFGQ